MRKVDLSMDANKKYETIKKLVETNGNKKRAAINLDCSERQINRMILGYKIEGKAFFIHGNTGKTPVNIIDQHTKQLVIDLYLTKYDGANFVHYSELLEKFENIKVSPTFIRNTFLEKYILSPKARRSTKKNLKEHLREIQKNSLDKKESLEIFNALVNIEDAHPRRPRCAYSGEMLQMDASLHHWFGTDKTQLHIAVDDATGLIMGAYFDTQETLKGYYNVLYQILTIYGIPNMFFTDRRTVFEYKKKSTSSLEEDTFTQFGYACSQLGIEIKTSSVAQAKGRVERMFQTLQSRLPLEMRLAGISSLEQANEFLNSYIKEFNAQFALPFNSIKSVFETQSSDEKINLTLAILTNRKIDNGHCIKFEKSYYKPIDVNGYPVYYHKGTSCIVIKAFDESMYICINEKIYALDAVPAHAVSSKNFDVVHTSETPRKRYIPPMNHPWRQSSFEKYLKKQAHRQELSA
jgi:hypothetical protein